jgi:hypothetical protein
MSFSSLRVDDFEKRNEHLTLVTAEKASHNPAYAFLS